MVEAKTYGISGTLTETYNYDALGNRIAKTTDGVKTEYVIDYSTGYAQVLRATTDAGTVFYTRGFELISRKDATRELWYLTDGGGSVRFLTDSTGSVTDSLVFDAFGNTVSRAGQTGDSYGFQGEQQDATGLYYLRARYMNPATGSFTQMDTYGGSLSDPMSLHKYLFANANPVKYRDPSGHMAAFGEQVACIAIISIISSVIEMDLYIVDYDKQVENGREYSYSEYAMGLGNAFLHGLALGAASIACIALISMFALSALSCVLCAAILLVAGLTLECWATILDNQNNSLWADILRYIKELCFAGSLTCLFEAGAAGGASAAEENGASSSAEEGAAARGSTGQGYKTFNELKQAVGSPGEDNQWHHIVEQSQISKSGFDPTQIHNTNNIIAVDKTIHGQISGYYSSKQAFTGGQTVRNWLAGQSFDAQYEFGIQKLKDFGVAI